jgi:hypothetical protein
MICMIFFEVCNNPGFVLERYFSQKRNLFPDSKDTSEKIHKDIIRVKQVGESDRPKKFFFFSF